MVTIIKVLCYCYLKTANIDLRKTILELVTSDSAYKKILDDVYRNFNTYVCVLADKKTNLSLQTDTYKNFNSTRQIINKINEKLPDLSLRTGYVTKNNIFYCNKDYFNNDGTLNYETIKNDPIRSLSDGGKKKYIYK